MHTQTQTHTKTITIVMLNSTNLMQKTVILINQEHQWNAHMNAHLQLKCMGKTMSN